MPRGGARPNSGPKEGSQHWRKMALSAAQGALTQDVIVADLAAMEAKERAGVTIKYIEIDMKEEEHGLHMETEPQLAKGRLKKLEAETRAIESASASKVIDEERAQIKIDDMIKQISE